MTTKSSPECSIDGSRTKVRRSLFFFFPFSFFFADLPGVGYNVIVATAADEGWAQLQDPKNDITLVITDANMPGEYDGFGLLDRIMKLKEEQGIDVIMMSGQ